MEEMQIEFLANEASKPKEEQISSVLPKTELVVESKPAQTYTPTCIYPAPGVAFFQEQKQKKAIESRNKKIILGIVFALSLVLAVLLQKYGWR